MVDQKRVIKLVGARVAGEISGLEQIELLHQQAEQLMIPCAPDLQPS